MHYPEIWMAPPPGPEKYYIDSIKNASSTRSWSPGIHYRLNLGTSFSSGGWFGNSIQTWVAPELNYRLNQRWNFRAGVMISNTLPIQNSKDAFGVSGTRDPLSGLSYLFYTGADYQVNEKLIISADVMKSVVQNSKFDYFSPGAGNFESYAFSFNYKLSRSFSIGGNIRLSNGNDPYNYYPLFPGSRNYFASPPFGY